ncbi:chaplin [Streptomyces sp. TP-A0874]|uniref:chaplin n=1 Tax=Streptomyces sp. TP-A0874 TaxID=549819 RepID=UPI000853ACF1|nr:chaplin [Streptomyces sp. TP-A0874]
MSRIAKAAVVTIAAGAAIAGGTGAAFADSGAKGIAEHSPGAVSGNTIQVPVHVPVNLCGNTITVIGLFNNAAGTFCHNG